MKLESPTCAKCGAMKQEYIVEGRPYTRCTRTGCANSTVGTRVKPEGDVTHRRDLVAMMRRARIKHGYAMLRPVTR